MVVDVGVLGCCQTGVFAGDQAELDELVAQLVRSGDDLAAGQLLMRRRGCSSTEAHKFLEEQASRI